jgi:hypothetical protein
MAGGSTTDNRSYSPAITVNLYGVADRDVPQAVVQAIAAKLGGMYQNQAAIAGNVRLPG